MSASNNKKSVLRCIELYNQCTMEWVDACYSDKLEWIELPKPGTPQGRRGDLSFFRKSAEQVLNLFPDRKLTVLRSMAEKDGVVLEQAWEGTVAYTTGSLLAGRIARLRVVSFFTLEHGLIVKQVDYCVSVV